MAAPSTRNIVPLLPAEEPTPPAAAEPEILVAHLIGRGAGWVFLVAFVSHLVDQFQGAAS
jgi:hypothetical protein